MNSEVNSWGDRQCHLGLPMKEWFRLSSEAPSNLYWPMILNSRLQEKAVDFSKLQPQSLQTLCHLPCNSI